MAILLVQNKSDVYNTKQLEHFKKEMGEAGGFDELMLIKNATERKNGSTYITIHKDIEDYKDKFLTGIYEPLRSSYETEVPYVFWGKMYELVKRISPRKKI